VIPLVAVVLSGVITLAACSSGSGSSPAPSDPPSTTTVVAAAPPSAPLTPPTALTDVLYRLADPSIPGADKVGLVQYATADDAAALDRFGQALNDGGFTPVTFDATELAFSQSNPNNVVATITVSTANQQGPFVFPMEFNPVGNGWQLTRKTADMLLQLGATPSATPPR
jgi:uncharacterized lipoprotein YbaY